MGILELHFHDSEFVFGPSIGGEDAAEDAAEAVDEMVGEDESTKSPLLALAVGLLFALVLAGLAKKKAGGDHDGVEIEELEP
jgi:hypothetical protein